MISFMLLVWSGHDCSRATTLRSTSSSHSWRRSSSCASAASQPAGPSVRRIRQQKSSSGAGCAGLVNRMNLFGNCSRNLCHFFLNCRVTTASYSSGCSFLMMFCTRSDGTDPGCAAQKSTMACSSAAIFSFRPALGRRLQMSSSESECPSVPSENTSERSENVCGRARFTLVTVFTACDLPTRGLHGTWQAGQVQGRGLPVPSGQGPGVGSADGQPCGLDWTCRGGKWAGVQIVVRLKPGYQ
mmetsp:Transcript_13642/g.24368  ORF Transcript_13642/g.24368 Transcript_13642/m.24368 type:complete len:242 (-) Transcript_13642:376-1101(-)